MVEVRITDRGGKQFLEILNNLGAAKVIDSYEYMGEKKIGDYIYYGFKERGGTCWKISRENKNDASAWQYAYADDGWTAAWTDPTSVSYDDPPDIDPS